MQKERTSKGIFEKCEKDTKFLFQQEVDIRKIKAMKILAENDLDAVKQIMETDKENNLGNIIYKIHYDCLLMFVEAFLRFDLIKSTNHQCVFAYLIEKHPNIDLDWNFFEKMRTKRNGSVYYGQPITFQDWNQVKVQMLLYLGTMKKVLENKIEEYERKYFDEE